MCCRHGQGHKEGIHGAGDILRDAGFHYEIQALCQLVSRGLAGSVGFGHGSAVGGHSLFHCVLDGGSVCGQLIGQSLVQGIGGEVVSGAVRGISIGVLEADGVQNSLHGSTFGKAVEDNVLHIALVVICSIGGDVGQLQVGKLHALNGVFAQRRGNGGIGFAGRHIGAVPRLGGAGLGNAAFQPRFKILINIKIFWYQVVWYKFGKYMPYQKLS